MVYHWFYLWPPSLGGDWICPWEAKKKRCDFLHGNGNPLVIHVFPINTSILRDFVNCHVWWRVKCLQVAWYWRMIKPLGRENLQHTAGAVFRDAAPALGVRWDIHELPRPSIWGYTLYIYISDSHNLWPGKSVLSQFRGQKMLVHQRPVLLLILGLQPRSAWNLVQAPRGTRFVLIFWQLWQEFVQDDDAWNILKAMEIHIIESQSLKSRAATIQSCLASLEIVL